MRLLQAQKIKTRMLYLLNAEGTTSPHTIGEAYIEGRWVILDPMFEVIVYNKDGKLISRTDILKNPDIIKNLPVFQERLRDKDVYNNDEKRFNAFIDCYTNPAMFVGDME
jgi:hypothetical protein